MLTAMDKTWIALGLVVLALFEFFTAMYVYGRKAKDGPKKHAKLMLRLHRIGGYVFLIWMIFVIWIGVDLLHRLWRPGTGYLFHGPAFFHALLGVVTLLLLLLKLSFVRIYTNYRQQARMLGIVLTLLTLTTWLIAGWFFLIRMGRPMVTR